jgi:pimeloyl-ACP methyl ester carboxylesterase
MKETSRIIHCISGLGADERAFVGLRVNGYELLHLRWFANKEGETIESYASRMWDQVLGEEPIIIGLSFGAMVAIEMSKHKKLGALIVVSAPKTRQELPMWMRLSGKLKLHKILPIASNRYTEKADDRRMGIKTPEEKAFVEFYRKNADRKHINWGVNEILNWKNTHVPENVFHIHGDKDRMFPIKYIQPNYTVSYGTHIMILNRAMEIGNTIEEHLERSHTTELSQSPTPQIISSASP